jgi:hypothetical protein
VRCTNLVDYQSYWFVLRCYVRTTSQTYPDANVQTACVRGDSRQLKLFPCPRNKATMTEEHPSFPMDLSLDPYVHLFDVSFGGGGSVSRRPLRCRRWRLGRRSSSVRLVGRCYACRMKPMVRAVALMDLFLGLLITGICQYLPYYLQLLYRRDLYLFGTEPNGWTSV